MRPRSGELLHFSEDPSITRFVPHVAKTSTESTAYVWAVDAALAPGYWFPRQCPRAMAWVTTGTTDADRQRILGPHTTAVHMIEYAWLQRIQAARLFAYRFDASDFEPYGDAPEPHACVSQHAVEPLGPTEPVGDLLTLHDDAPIEVRLTHNTSTTSPAGLPGARPPSRTDAAPAPAATTSARCPAGSCPSSTRG